MDEIIIVKMPGTGAHEPDEQARLDGIMPMYRTLVEFCEQEQEYLRHAPRMKEMVYE